MLKDSDITVAAIAETLAGSPADSVPAFPVQKVQFWNKVRRCKNWGHSALTQRLDTLVLFK